MRKKKKKINDFERSSIDYFNDINKLSPLSREEEHSLWEKYKKENDMSARDKIIKSNLKFVASVAKPYIGMGLSYSDLIAEGNMGLIKALDKFDYEKGYKTISYSVWWIKQNILEALKKRNIINGDEITPSETFDEEDNIDEDDNVTTEKYVDTFNFDTLKRSDETSIVKDLMESLTDREKRVVTDYFGLDSKEEMTLEEIGKEMGLTKERIRQIKESALKKLRTEALKNSITSETFK
jgi:RNA polymerase primary sigma factor